MPIRIANNLPARHILEQERIFVMEEERALSQDIRPIRIVILNLMPNKVVTETQILRSLSNSPIQVDIDLLCTASYVPSHTSEEHLTKFYDTKTLSPKITSLPTEQLKIMTPSPILTSLVT